MQYKTIVLELLQQFPQIHERLRQQRILLSTLERQASRLKARHEDLMEVFSQAEGMNDPQTISSSALEVALQELMDRLTSDSLDREFDILSLEAAMDYLRRHSSTG